MGPAGEDLVMVLARRREEKLFDAEELALKEDLHGHRGAKSTL